MSAEVKRAADRFNEGTKRISDLQKELAEAKEKVEALEEALEQLIPAQAGLITDLKNAVGKL